MSTEAFDPSGIAQAERLTSVVHKWPSFHDAEVMAVRMSRLGPDAPTVELDIWVFSGGAFADFPDGFPSVLVTLRFLDVSEVELLDFNPQNVLGSLGFEKTSEGWKVTLYTVYGLYGGLVAKAVEVVAVEPYQER